MSWCDLHGGDKAGENACNRFYTLIQTLSCLKGGLRHKPCPEISRRHGSSKILKKTHSPLPCCPVSIAFREQLLAEVPLRSLAAQIALLSALRGRMWPQYARTRQSTILGALPPYLDLFEDSNHLNVVLFHFLQQNNPKQAPLKPIVIQKSGISLIHDPLYNKGTAWPKQERDRLALRGLVPPAYLDLNVRMYYY